MDEKVTPKVAETVDKSTKPVTPDRSLRPEGWKSMVSTLWESTRARLRGRSSQPVAVDQVSRPDSTPVPQAEVKTKESEQAEEVQDESQENVTPEAYLGKVGFDTKNEHFMPTPEEFNSIKKKVDRLKMDETGKSHLVADISSSMRPAQEFAQRNKMAFDLDTYVDVAVAGLRIRDDISREMREFTRDVYTGKYSNAVIENSSRDGSWSSVRTSEYTRSAALLHSELKKHNVPENARAIPYVFALAAGEFAAENRHVDRELVHGYFIDLIDDLLPVEDQEGSEARGLGSKVTIATTSDNLGKPIQVLRDTHELKPFIRGRLNEQDPPEELRTRINRGQQIIGRLTSAFKVSQPTSKDMDSEVSNNAMMEQGPYAGVDIF